MKKRAIILTMFFTAMVMASTAAGEIICVDVDANGLNDGSSWADAFNDLQDALTTAQYGDEIRVAQGIYTPVGPIVPVPQGQASNPNPADGAKRVAITSDLSWTAGLGATSHDVYFGTSYSPPFIRNQASTTFDPSTMDYSTAYYWRIDEVNNGDIITGTVWSFRTDGPGPSSPPQPLAPSATPSTVERTATFQLINSVVIKGGYAGSNEPDPGARDITAYETILSGDIGILVYYWDNSYHVVTGNGTDETAVLDGFVISGGYANGSHPHDQGGGMINERGSPTLVNCTFSGNSANRGGGMYNYDWAWPTLTNCTFSGNSAHDGGGMYNYESSPALTLINCRFIGNSADRGGGMYNYDWAWPTLTNCTFSDNEAMWGGGAVYNLDSYPTLTNCSLKGNLAGQNGGAVYNYESSPTITNCTFGGNSAHENGGAIYIYSESNPSVTNCTFNGNYAQNGKAIACDSWYQFYPSNPQFTNCIFWDGGGEIWNNDDSEIIITYSDLQGCWPGEGNIDADPCFFNSGYWDVNSIWVEGDYHLKSKAGRWDPKSQEWIQDDLTSPCIDAGSPNSPIAFEPLPNGGVVNMGAYGGTTQASKSMVPITSGRIIFVDPDATGVSNGSSWVHAYNHLQDALAAATYGDQIWVAQGIYKPDQGHGITPGDCLATFRIRNGLTIRGSYAGFGQPDPNARDTDLYETILCGDIGTAGVSSDNCYHVVTASGTDKTAVLDSFTITCGFANVGHDLQGDGGGMLNNQSNPTVINCTFIDNGAIEGGGMANLSSSPTLTNCNFIGNRAHIMGAGLNNYKSSPMLTNCTFSGNSVKHDGGGMANFRSSPTLIACTFTGNLAAYGGGIYDLDGIPNLRNCIFSGNSANYGGGMWNGESSPRMTNCIFSGNLAKLSGGGIYVWVGASGPGGGCYMGNPCNVTLINCTFAENLAEEGRSLACGSCDNRFPSKVKINNSILWNGGNGIWNNDNSTIMIAYSDIQASWPWPGEGNIDSDPCFVDTGYWDANGLWIDGDYHLLPDSPCINAGDPNHPYDPNETDLDGKPRVIGGRIDMGAYEYSPTIMAFVRIVPRTINLANKGKWISCYIWLPEQYNVADIEQNSIFLDDEIQPEHLSLDEQEQVAIANFSRGEVHTILEVGDINLKINGQLTDGTAFEATDVIRVIDKGGKEN